MNIRLKTVELKIVVPAELQIGDVVRLQGMDCGYGDCTVVQIEEGWATLKRLYIHLGEFTYTGGVLNFIGTETIKVPVNQHIEYVYLGNIYRGPRDAEGKVL